MQNLSLLLQVCLQHDLVGLPLGLAEDDGSSVSSSVEVDYVCDDGVSLVVGNAEGEMFDGL